MRYATEDSSLRAVVVGRRPLTYAGGADPASDRPAWVRAASGVAVWGDRLAIVQDDALFLALADPRTGRCDAVPLPAPDGVRLFDKGRGNKMGKPDHECLVRLGDRLVGLGSGSAPGRDRLLLSDGRTARWFDGSALYARLAARADFAGDELNVEGAAVIGDRLRLFNRGNGAGRAVDATLDLDLGAFTAWLDGGPCPEPGDAQPWSLGTIDGVRLTFTDAATRGGALWFLAAAEASPNAVDDGAVVGAALGRFTPDGAVWTRITEDGAPILDKVEGLAFEPDAPDRAWVVVDADDPSIPATLIELALSGM